MREISDGDRWSSSTDSDCPGPDPRIPVKDYTCAVCQGEFVSVWSEDEAYDEAVTVFGEKTVKTMEMAKVCDLCYKKLIANFS